MDLQPRSWTNLRWIEPQSRWLLRTLFKRDLDVMTESARRTANWSVLILDVVVAYILIQWL